MKKIGIFKWLVALVLIVVLGYFGFTAEVREGECAVITRFGAPRAEITEAGLYLRLPWPFEDIAKYDARRQYLESNYLETLTRDKRNIILNRKLVKNVVFLENKADEGIPVAVEIALREMLTATPLNENFTACRGVQTTTDVQKGRFTATAFTE